MRCPTVGSLVGAFLPALVLIPLVGTQRTMLLSAAVLAASAVPLLGRRWLVAVAAPALLLARPARRGQGGGRACCTSASRAYQFIQVRRASTTHAGCT